MEFESKSVQPLSLIVKAVPAEMLNAMPGRITQQTLPEGPSAGSVFEAEELLDDYYRSRGWDLVSGVPTAEKLHSLGLGYTLG